jgi:hypothetical protein
LMDYYRINYRDKTFNLTELKGGERK